MSRVSRLATALAGRLRGVLSVLRNRIYVGEVPFRRIWYAGHHEPIIEQPTFEQAQAILAERAAKPALRRTNPTTFLLSGLPLICDRCGHPMAGASARGHSGRRYAYYTHPHPPRDDSVRTTARFLTCNPRFTPS
jgi:hypothetical protein